jgi:DNA-binding response OmpR family regulator
MGSAVVRDNLVDDAKPPLLLVIEDERSVAHALEACFLEEGYRVVTAGDAYAALRTLETLCPALVTLNLAFPA